MANRTDPSAKQIHGMNPQFLLETILRNKIYTCFYWKEKCFALTNETIIDAAVELKYVGGKLLFTRGTYGGNKQPSDFICLILKLLQLQPDKEIVLEYLNNKDYKYLTALAAFYIRLTFKPADVYTNLENIYSDFRKVRVRNPDGSYEILRMDEFIDELFLKEAVFEVTLPVIPKRYILEQNNEIEPRVSLLDAELMLDDYEIKEEPNETIDANTPQKKDFFADSDDEKALEDERKKDETQGINAKRWDKADLDKEENFNRDKYFETFDKKHRKKSRSRDKKKHSKRSRSRSSSKRRERKDRDSKKDREEKKEKYGKKEDKVEKKEEKVLDENSVEYWNSLRAKLGLNLIPESK